MKVRRAVRGDIPELMELLDQVNLIHHRGRPDLFKHATKYTEDELAGIIDNDMSPVFVAVGKPADGDDIDGTEKVLGHGFGVIQQAPEEHNILTPIKTLYIDDICVNEKARGMGVGKEIYDYIMEYARDIGCYNVTLNVWAFNEGAKAFYEIMGMKPQKYGMEIIL